MVAIVIVVILIVAIITNIFTNSHDSITVIPSVMIVQLLKICSYGARIVIQLQTNVQTVALKQLQTDKRTTWWT